MDLYELMKNRRSTREFLNKKVPEEKLNLILKAGRFAPSGADQKPYVYIVIDDMNIKKAIKQYCEDADKRYYDNSEEWFKKWMEKKNIFLEKNFLVDAPYLIVVIGETDKPYWLESTWMSISYMILAAEVEGLGTLTYTPAETDFIKNLLELPKKVVPVTIIPIGYAKCPQEKY